MENEDIERTLRAAKNIRITYRHGLLNPLSSLPEPKAKIKLAIKERIRQLAGAYVSLATYIDDDDLFYADSHPRSKKTKRLYDKVLEDIETAQKEMRRFRLLK